jgi:hypothetical protein
VRLGCTYIQLDAPHYPLLIDPGWRAFYQERGWPLQRWLGYGIELDNAVIDAGRPATFGFHLCRGNQLSRWLVAGGLTATVKETSLTFVYAYRQDEFAQAWTCWPPDRSICPPSSPGTSACAASRVPSTTCASPPTTSRSWSSPDRPSGPSRARFSRTAPCADSACGRTRYGTRHETGSCCRIRC